MEYGKLGNTDIKVSKLCLGCMSFGKRGTMHDWTLNENESEKIIKFALDAGINFFDTANGYSAGTSEEYLGKALKNTVPEMKLSLLQKCILMKDAYQKKSFLEKLMVLYLA